jgi:hypothetical protein
MMDAEDRTNRSASAGDGEISDAVPAQDGGDMSWRSAKLRMARMVDPIGCDALADRVFVFRVPAGGSGFAAAIAIGRSLEREETGGTRTQWRFAEVKKLDVLPVRELDDTEVYYEMSEVDAADVVSFGTVFHPERFQPVRRRLVTAGQQDATPGAPTWFSAKLRFVSLIEGLGSHFHDDSVYVLQAKDFEDAFGKAISIGRARERDYVNMQQERVHRRLVEVSSLNLLGSGELGNVVEVNSEAAPLQDADRIPFNTTFHPERSQIP